MLDSLEDVKTSGGLARGIYFDHFKDHNFILKDMGTVTPQGGCKLMVKICLHMRPKTLYKKHCTAATVRPLKVE